MEDASLESAETLNDCQAEGSVDFVDLFHVDANDNWMQTVQSPHCQNKFKIESNKQS